MDPISQQATQKISEQALQQGSAQPQPRGEASGADVARFEEALGQGPDAALQTMQPPGADGASPAATGQVDAAQPDSLGDAILQGLEKMKATHDARMDNIHNKIAEADGGEMTMQQALALQFEVMQMGIEQDLTTKVADKTSQGVQTLFRNQ